MKCSDSEAFNLGSIELTCTIRTEFTYSEEPSCSTAGINCKLKQNNHILISGRIEELPQGHTPCNNMFSVNAIHSLIYLFRRTYSCLIAGINCGLECLRCLQNIWTLIHCYLMQYHFSQPCDLFTDGESKVEYFRLLSILLQVH